MPNLDLYRQDAAGLPRLRIASLRTDPPELIYERIAALERPPAPPSYRELAERYGDPESRKLHGVRPGWNGLLLKWLTLWREEVGVPWA
jgi:hypothetical protein